MFFVKELDGTPVEFIGLPDGAAAPTRCNRASRGHGTGQVTTTKQPAAIYSHADSRRGHVAIVTGSARGIGKGVAAACSSEGHSFCSSTSWATYSPPPPTNPSQQARPPRSSSPTYATRQRYAHRQTALDISGPRTAWSMMPWYRTSPNCRQITGSELSLAYHVGRVQRSC